MNQRKNSEDDGNVLGYVSRRVNTGEGSQKWQVDPQDIRLFVERNLKGEREVEVTRFMYHLRSSGDERLLKKFYCESKDEAKELLYDYCDGEDVSINKVFLVKTDKKKVTNEVRKISKPLVNEVGAYHVLSIIEGVFSRIGYMSKLKPNEINDILFEDVLQPLVLTIFENHREYGIEKGSRNELVGFVISTCKLILNSSQEGWTGDRFAGTVQERIHTKDLDGQKVNWGMK